MIVSIGQIEIFTFIFARIIGIFLAAPIFNSRSISPWIKTAFAIWMALVLWFVTPVKSVLPYTIPLFFLTLIIEVTIGFLIGFVCNVIFLAVQAGGEIMDMQMGLSVATAFDPVFGAVISVVGKLAFWTAMVIFIAINGHHMILSALHQSFTIIPTGEFMLNFSNPAFFNQLAQLGASLWLTAIKVAAPIVLLIFISDFSFGIVSRVAPQVNVFMLGFQVKPSLGLFAFLMSLPFLVRYIVKLTGIMGQQVIILLTALK